MGHEKELRVIPRPDSSSPTAPAWGSVNSLVESLRANSGVDVYDLLRERSIDTAVIDTIQQSVQTANYVVVDRDSVATDHDVVVPHDLLVQKCEVKGQDLVYVHKSLLTHFRETFIDKSSEKRLELLTTWEMSRYIGRLLHNNLLIRLDPLPLVKFGALDFSKKVCNELSDEPVDIEEVSNQTARDHYLYALPERVASAVGLAILRDSEMATEAQLNVLIKKMRSHALQPLYNALEFTAGSFGRSILPMQSGGVAEQIASGDAPFSFAEMGAVFPLDYSDLNAYCQYLEDTDRVISLI